MTKIKNEHEAEFSKPPVKSAVKEKSNDGVPPVKTNVEVSDVELLNGLIVAGERLENDPTINDENAPANDKGLKESVFIGINESGERTELNKEKADDEEVKTPEITIEAPAENDDAPIEAPEMGTQLSKFAGFRAELALVETIAEIKFIGNKAAAAAEFARRNRMGMEEQNEWGKFRVEIEDLKGKWLNEYFPQGGPKARSKGATMTSEGITKTESSHARLVSDNPVLAKKVMSNIENDRKKIITPNAVVTGIRSILNPEKRTAKPPKKEAPVPPIPPDNTNVLPATDNATKAPETGEYALQVEKAKSIILGLQKQRSIIAKEIIAIEKQKKERTTPKQIEKFEKESSNKQNASDKIIHAIENAYAELGCFQLFGTTIKKAKKNGYKTLVDSSSL